MMVRVGHVIKSSRVRLQAVPLLCNDSGQVVYTHVPLSSSSIIWYWPKMLNGWEGNRGAAESNDSILSGL